MKTRLVIAVVVSLWGHHASNAQDATLGGLGLALCRAIKEDRARLECFDKVTTPRAAATEPPAASSNSWTINESASPIDDSAQFSAVLLASDDKAALALRCQEHKTEVVVLPKDYIGSTGDGVRVLYRINNEPAIQARWHGATSGRGAFVSSAVAFIKSLPDDGTLFIRLFDFRGAPHDASWMLGKVSPIRSKLSETCRWAPAENADRRKDNPAKSK